MNRRERSTSGAGVAGVAAGDVARAAARPADAPGRGAPRNSASRSRTAKSVATGLMFLTPNILGFLTFTAIPIVVSLTMAFTNWDLKLHNRLRDEAARATGAEPEVIRFVGLENFARLLASPEFPKYLGNTLFLMMGLPVGIALSLGAALLLSRDLRGKTAPARRMILGVALTVVTTGLLLALGLGASGVTLLVACLAASVVIAGSLGNVTAYRTLFYVPHFTAGVATFLLWKKMFAPATGPMTMAVAPVVDGVQAFVTWAGPVVLAGGAWGMTALAGLCVAAVARLLYRGVIDGEIGVAAALLGAVVPVTGVAMVVRWTSGLTPAEGAVAVGYDPVWYGRALAGVALLAGAACAARWAMTDRSFVRRGTLGTGTALFAAMASLAAMLVCAGLAVVLHLLPAWASDGAPLQPPKWIAEYAWAKPSIMMMGLWAAVGSNTMLLYLAALSNVPPELYEAADIDGASPGQRFWHVTWPQLAPTTFFVVVMGMIGGLQGGFEVSRVMTNGGPAGSTTTLAYFIFTEGFETGRLGYASAVAWTMFLLVLTVTMFNWRFGNRYVND